MGSFGRTMKRAGRKQNKKSGAGWMTGQQAKEVKAGERASMPPPPKPRKPSKPRARSAPPVAERGRRELSTNPGAVRKRERTQQRRDAERAVADHGERGAEQLAAPARPSEAAGATASNRAASCAKPGRSADAARQAIERQVRKLVAEIVRQAKKDPLAAAAALGGAVRDPNVRSLLAQAGITLSEQIEMDTALICMFGCTGCLGSVVAAVSDRFMSIHTRPDR